MTVAEAQHRIGSTEFAEWLAFYQLEPFGDERADLRAAIMPFLFATAFRKRGKTRPSMDDFMVSSMLSDSTDEPMAVREMEMTLRRLARSYEEHQRRHGNDINNRG